MKRVIVFAAVVFALLMTLAGCGSSKSSSTTTSTVTVAILPNLATLNTGATQQFTATVSNSTNTAVTWSVNTIIGGSQGVGFISSSGLYTAPNSVPTPAQVTVSATSQADTKVTASAQATITAPATPTVSMVVSPSAVTVPAGQTQLFTATVSGNPIAVNWTLNCQSAVTGACGTIGTDGTYTAPLSPPPGGNVSVTATAKDNSVPPSGAVVTVQFGNGSLNGQYAFNFSGQNAGVSYLAAGSATFDGKGNITSGTEDINSGGVSSVTITSGTYHVGTDGRGNATVVTSAGTVNWQFAVVNHSHALVIRFDSGVPSASGSLDLQDASQFTAAGFTGSYSLNLSGANSSGKPGTLAAAGALTSNGAGVLSGGALDVNSAGTFSTGLSLSGSYGPPTSSGRGTMTTAGFGTQNFAYYIVDANHVKVIELDASVQLAGDLFKQPTGPFSNASLKGSYVFAFLGSSTRGPLGEGGVVTLDDKGKLTTGTIDINDDGTPGGGSASGTYILADTTTGRTTVSVTAGGATLQYAIYPQINGALSVVEIDTSNTGAGRALRQTATFFSTGTILGNNALNFSGAELISNPGEEDISGQVIPNGSSAITGILDIKHSGVTPFSETLTTGSYSCDLSCQSSGRGSATLGTSSFAPSGTFNYYVADGSNVLFLESDGNRVLVGTMQKQF